MQDDQRNSEQMGPDEAFRSGRAKDDLPDEPGRADTEGHIMRPGRATEDQQPGEQGVEQSDDGDTEGHAVRGRPAPNDAGKIGP
jgi:hypothetical protein